MNEEKKYELPFWVEEINRLLEEVKQEMLVSGELIKDSKDNLILKKNE